MTIESSSDTSAVRLSRDDDVAHRIVRDGGEPAEPSRRTGLPDLAHVVLSRYALVLVWGAMALVFYALRPEVFGSSAAFSSIFGSQQTLVFVAMAAMVTLVVGEFDLSIASIMGLTATLVPVMVSLHGHSIEVACAVAIVAALVSGAVNAFFVVYLNVSSFVVTLGTGTLLIGLSQAVSSSSIVSVSDPGFSALTLREVAGMPISFYYGIALAVLLAYLLAYTPLGRHMLFVGGNREVARLAGIHVQRIRAGAYLASSLLAGVAGLLLVSTQGGFDPATSATFLLPALAAVFLGTAVVQPGQFNPVGTMIAIYFLTTGIFGLQLLGFAGWIQNVFYGGGLVVAVALANILRSRARTA